MDENKITITKVINDDGVVVCEGIEDTPEFTSQLLEHLEGLGCTIITGDFVTMQVQKHLLCLKWSNILKP